MVSFPGFVHASTWGSVQGWRALLLEVLPAGKFSQERGNVTPSRFLNSCCFRCRHHPAPHRWLWSASETGHIGRNSILPGQYNRPGKFSIFRENYQSKLYLQGFRYTNDMGRLAEGRLVASFFMSSSLPFNSSFKPDRLEF